MLCSVLVDTAQYFEFLVSSLAQLSDVEFDRSILCL